LVQRLVLIPKVPGLVRVIPERIGSTEILLGYSVPTRYGGSPIGLWELGRRPVHLLGGSPQRQLELSQYLNVVSVDGNMAHLQAHRCRFWSRKPKSKGHWVQLSETGDCAGNGANLRAFLLSLDAIRSAWY